LFHHLLALPLGFFGAPTRRRQRCPRAQAGEYPTIHCEFGGNACYRHVFHCGISGGDGLVFDHFDADLHSCPAARYGTERGLYIIFPGQARREISPGAENQVFLDEAVSGVETLKAIAVEPQMQRRWEEQLSGYVTGVI